MFALELANNRNITVSQGSASAAMSLRCGVICSDHFEAKFVLGLEVKEF